ncbi:hypothetical protein P3X46_002476 [Hevea brasiliensis]|uniref:Protein CPR-5-like n=1 Tax=Hevea brasiliensis TaxID=3981 RepID=A0ABQ9N3X3_HEVBR|nr:protein CPR-5-like [Hevea brasiliensis]KAJ9186971.1 hypothetical protein P3X46_002476 [Hevea brasiliensis]
MESLSSSAPPAQESNTTANSNPTVESLPFSEPFENGNLIMTRYKEKEKKKKREKKKKKADEDVVMMSSSSFCSAALPSKHRSTRIAYKRKNPKVVIAPVRRGDRFREGDLNAVALPLGMSFAAIVAQVLERKDVAGEKMSVDYLSKICALAVRESLANVVGDKFEFFARNFEKSFGSTLRTLRLINEASINKEAYHSSHLNVESWASHLTLENGVDCGSSGIKDYQSETELPSISAQNQVHVAEDAEESVPCLNQELPLNVQLNQQICVPSSLGSVINHRSTIEKLVMEEARSNDLKTLEIGLTMKKLELKEAQLALSFDSNHLERSKLAMGVSKASFKAEKFKNQVEDTKHAELLKTCIDCLVAGLFLMSACLLYGAYVFSYQRITDATASCNPSVEESKSRWFPRPFSSFNSGLHTLRCHVQVVSRMLFGMLIILAVAYLLLQRSAMSRQTMPVTFILLLLGAVCGFAGKFCVDTLGGSGLHWLLYWETLCLLHFFSNVFTSTLFYVLHGPVTISDGIKSNAICPYWFRRILFYTVVLLFLPLSCGLLPFAGPGEWKDHFLKLATNSLFITDD